MENVIKRYKNKNNIYILTFLFSVNVALTAYINSSYLKEFFTESSVGYFFAVSSIAVIWALAIMPKILSRFGLIKTTLTLGILQIFLALSLSALNTPALIAFIFITHITIVPLIAFNLDVLLENSSQDKNTGKIRSISLTIANIAYVLSPLGVGFLVGASNNYWKTFVVSAFVLFLLIIFLYKYFKNFVDPEYTKVPFWKTLREVYRRKNIYRIFMSSAVLNFFYAWMVIYTPIYLNSYIGMPWSKIGIIFTIMLLPFILFQIPAGWLADRKWGEKEFLSIGLIIMGISAGAITFITSSSIAIWGIVLFMTRVGASLVEIMTESYFFKQINSTDTNIISFFRNARPIAYILATTIASFTLTFIDFRFMFLILGVIVLGGLKYSLALKDTR